MTTVELLKAARKRIEDPARWTQNAYARDAASKKVNPKDPAAVCWCALGAIDVEAGVYFNIENDDRLPVPDAAIDRLHAAAMRLTVRGITSVNDGLDHPATLRMFDAAIADTEATA